MADHVEKLISDWLVSRKPLDDKHAAIADYIRSNSDLCSVYGISPTQGNERPYI